MGAKKTAPSTLVLVAVRQTQNAMGSIHQNSKMYSTKTPVFLYDELIRTRIRVNLKNQLVQTRNRAAA